MSDEAPPLHNSSPSVGILTIPTDILFHIVAELSISEIRYLARVNRRFKEFAEDYLTRYRYKNARLLALPDTVILNIVRHLPSVWSPSRLSLNPDRVYFAQASYKLYPLISRYILEAESQDCADRMLQYAVATDLGRMTRTLISLGADVNAVNYDVRYTLENQLQTPLVIAAGRGHERMVKLLLSAGASHLVRGGKVPLMEAIVMRNKKVAMLLSQELDSAVVRLWEDGSTALQLACIVQHVSLVEYYLKFSSQHQGNIKDILQDRSIALYLILAKDERQTKFIKRETKEPAYQIVLKLLEYGANPDIHFKKLNRFGSFTETSSSARDMASRHPDPRVRNLLLKPTATIGVKQSDERIGRRWVRSSQNNPLTLNMPQINGLLYYYGVYAQLLGKTKQIEDGDDGGDEKDGTVNDPSVAKQLSRPVPSLLRPGKTKTYAQAASSRP